MLKTLLVAVLVLGSSNPALAAKAIYLKGEVLHSETGKTFLPLAKDASPGPVVKTGANGWLILELADGSRVKLTPNSLLTIEAEKSEQISVRLDQGGVFSKIPKKEGASADRFTLRTKAAVMGVRGTSFFAAYGRAGKQGSLDEWMCVEEGVVEIRDQTKKKPQSVKAGEGVLVDAEHGVTAPKGYAWTKKLNWSMDPEKEAVDSKVDLESAYSNLRRLIYD